MKFPREVSLGDDGAIHVLGGPEDVDRVVRDFYKALGTLEEIGQFDSGRSGDLACAMLQELGVWNENVQRV